MSRYLIENVKKGHYAIGWEGATVVAVQYNCDGISKWLINDSCVGFSKFYESTEDIFDIFIESENFEKKEFDEFIESINKIDISEFGGFNMEDFDDNDELIEALESEDDDAISLLKYVMRLSECDDSEADDLIQMGIGKYSDEIFDDECDFSNMTEEEKYRYRLQLEADMEYDSVLHDMYYEEFAHNKKALKKLKKETDDLKYNSWKEKFISEEFAKVNREDFFACPYVFAGIGSYIDIVHKDNLECFDDFIMNNGSAVRDEYRPATDEEIKRYIALNIGIE